MSEIWVSSVVFARLFGCSPSHVIRMCERDELQHKRIGRLWKVHRSELVKRGLAEDERMREDTKADAVRELRRLADEFARVLQRLES